MNTHCTNRRALGFTLTEFIVVIVVLALLAVMSLVGLTALKNKAQRINCANNLKEIGVAFQYWKEIHHGEYPMQIVVTNGEAMRLLNSGNAYILWRSLAAPRTTDWLSTNWQPYFEDWSTNDHSLGLPRYLYCHADANRTAQTNFTDLRDANISYFFNLDADESHPQMILDGDDNLMVDGVQVKPGIFKSFDPERR